MIVDVELTLTSIVQGVALTFLIEGSRHVLSMHEKLFWPYIISGLLIILIFWSRSVIHTLTVIRWPLEFWHNFFYIACALGEALLFTRVNNPLAWFAFGTGYAAIVWFLFLYDLHLIRARESDSAGDASNRLYALVRRDQWLNIAVLMPALFLFNLLSAILVHVQPKLEAGGHVWLGSLQLVTFAGYLVYVLRYFKTLIPLIGEARQEWRRASE